MMSILAYDGSRTIIGNAVFDQHIEKLANNLSVFLSKSGHQIGMVFRRDLAATSELYKIANTKRATAEALGLDFEDLIDEEVEVYSKYVYDETNYIVLISHPSLLDSTEVALERKKKNITYSKYEIPTFVDSQNILLLNSYLKAQHDTFVERVLTTFSNNYDFAAQVEKLDVTDALRAIKRSVSPQVANEHWTPQIPKKDDPTSVQFRWKTNNIQDDASHILWAPLPDQIMRTSIKGVDRASAGTYPSGSVLSEDRIYAPLLVDVPPRNNVTFTDLFVSLNNTTTTTVDGAVRSLPYAVSFMISGDGLAGTSIKATLAKFLAVVSTDNQNINDALSSLKHYAETKGAVVALSISMMTWAENNAFGIDEIQLRRSKLWRVFESWGGTQVMDKGGDPISSYTTNLLGLSFKSVAPKTPAPLSEALRLLPLCRQASPFSRGTVFNRTVDGKFLKIECFSAELTTWIKLYIGKPGSGKSLAMNNDIIQTCLMPGLQRLPLVFMVDVGLSSSGVINLLKDRLKPEDRHLAVYKRLRNDKRLAINPLDCSVGRMQPTPDQLNQIVAFLSTLVTPVEAMGNPERGLSNFLSQIVEQTFISKMEGSEKGSPYRYQKNNDLELDGLLAKAGIIIDEHEYNPSYYELVKICHLKGLYRARDLCHRYAMPILTDMISAAKAPDIALRYGGAISASGEPLINVFIRGIQEAIAMYEVFASHTKFDVDTARVVSLDLQDVIGTNPKQSSLFFQIARIFIKRKTAFTVDDIPLFPVEFQDYYSNLIREILEDKKIYAYDELHNVKRDPTLFAELERDGRELRKWNAELKLASQYPTDFGELPKSATMFLIADSGTTETQIELQKMLSLKPEDLNVLNNNVGLTPGGLAFLSCTKTRKSRYTSINVLTIGPKLIWSLTTDADDRSMKLMMLDQLPERIAIAVLSKEYPNGIRAIIAARKETLSKKNKSGTLNMDAEIKSIVTVMANETIQKHRTFIQDSLQEMQSAV